MKGLLSPKSIAVIGASNDKKKVGHSLMVNLKNFKGHVIPINLKGNPILGKKCYKSVLDFPKDIDMALVAIPAKAVPSVVKECVKKKIKNIVIISAGFSEIGNKKAEKDLLEITKGKARILGPNCFGIVAPHLNIDTTFALTTPKSGDIAFISQSGALWAAIAIYSRIQNFGFSYFISLGNMLDLDFSDFIKLLDKDDRTKAIVLYIERLVDGKHFMDIVKKCKKPVIAIKAGRSEAGKRATLSHTGSLAGSFNVYKTAFNQSGVILVNTLEEAFDKAKFLQMPKGKKVVIVTNAGGPGTLTADYCETHGFEVVKLPKNLRFEKLPRAWSHNNPIDIVGDADADRFRYVFDILTKNKSFFDAAIVVMTQQKMIDIKGTVKEIINFKRKLKKSLVVCWMTDADSSILEKEGIPCFFEPEKAVKSFVIKQ
ncbi:MAG: CoA-binding protein [Nanoarchaeota archaeon]|nr:CoA-binding protein [Nanoarchaeota archaeon]